MSTANLIKAFNKLVFQFNDDLIAVFPQESDFKLSKHTFELLDKVNYKKIFELVGPHLLMHRNYIENRDENFFITTDASQYVESDDLIIIKKLRDYWKKDMTPENKEKVWSYLSNSLKLTNMIIKSGFKFQ
tara:strand:- start:732 stop:1124 length:393 start_codon:yes stop_codon:yes gene_type:complete